MSANEESTGNKEVNIDAWQLVYTGVHGACVTIHPHAMAFGGILALPWLGYFHNTTDWAMGSGRTIFPTPSDVENYWSNLQNSSGVR